MLKVTALIFLISGCTTTVNNVINEPERSEYFLYCLQNNVMVTTCRCMEDKAVKKTGITKIKDATPEVQDKFIAALQSELDSCNEETKELVKLQEKQ